MGRLEMGFMKIRASVSRDRETYMRQLLKWASILMFIAIHAIMTISLRVEAIMTDMDNPCINSTQVCMTEMVKLFLAFLACLFLDARGSVWQLLSQLEKAFVEEGADMLKLCVPAVLYTAQNNLQYVIETSPLFVIMYDCKVITTALFYILMLNHRFNKREWALIVALTLGIGMVQAGETDVHYHHASNFVGTSAVVFACLTSGFAGVFFEKTLKDSNSSIWMINLELSMISSSLGMFTCLMEDTEAISRRGFFSGYDRWVILVIILQALAGLSIALLVKYADNIVKGFATGVSIIIACLIDQFLFNNHTWTASPLIGVVLILVSFGFWVAINQPLESPVYGVAGHNKQFQDHRGSADATEGGDGMVNVPIAGEGALVARPRLVVDKDKDREMPSPNRLSHNHNHDDRVDSADKGHHRMPRALAVPLDTANRFVDRIADFFSESDYTRRSRLASAHDKREV